MCEHNVLEDGHDAGLCAKCKLELVSLAGVCIHGISKMRYCYQCELANLRAENEQLKRDIQLAELRGMEMVTDLFAAGYKRGIANHFIHKTLLEEIERRRKELGV